MNNRDIFIQEYPAHSSRTVQLADGGTAYPYSALAVGRIEGLYRSLPALMSPDATDKDQWYVVNIDDDTTNGHIQAIAVLGATSEDQAKSWAIKTIGVHLNASPRAWHIAISSAKALKNFLDRSASRGSFAISQTMLDTIAKQITDTPVKWLNQDSCQLTSHNGNTSELLHELVKQDDAAQLVDSMNSADLACLLAELGAEEEDYNAIIVQYAKLDDFINRMNQAMGKAAVTKLSIANFTKTKPFKRNNVVNIALLWDLSDGQSMTIVFHNPDSTPSKLQAGDVLTSWKFMLNKRDITAAVSPEQGKNAQPTVIAQRMMLIAEKNSARFVRTNAKKDEKVKALSDLELANENTQNEIARILAQNEALQNEIDAVVANKSIASQVENNQTDQGVIRITYADKTGQTVYAEFRGSSDPVWILKSSRYASPGLGVFKPFDTNTNGSETIKRFNTKQDAETWAVENGYKLARDAVVANSSISDTIAKFEKDMREAGYILAKYPKTKRQAIKLMNSGYFAFIRGDDGKPINTGYEGIVWAIPPVEKQDEENLRKQVLALAVKNHGWNQFMMFVIGKKVDDVLYQADFGVKGEKSEITVMSRDSKINKETKHFETVGLAELISKNKLDDAAYEFNAQFESYIISQQPKTVTEYQIEPPMTNPDRDYLQSIIEGKTDLSNADDIEDKLTEISERLDAELEPIFEQAAEAFAQYAIAQAATV